MIPPGVVTAVSRGVAHRFSKVGQDRVLLVAGHGDAGDAHAGTTVKHRSRARRQPGRPNLRQVHLLQAELHDALNEAGFAVGAGELGENITTRGLDLLALPRGAVLHIGDEGVVEVTGLRNPCVQIERFAPGLLAQVLGRGADGVVVRRAGIMSVVTSGGEVRPGDRIVVELPPPPHRPLEVV
jgi:MOSC domain-containing protein YiiM